MRGNEKELVFEEAKKRSRFGGTAMEMFSVVFLQYLMIIFTLGIGAPWALCMRERWKADNTIIDGKQVVFDGTGGKLFFRYTAWSILTLFTLGIYGWKRASLLRDWMTEHTHLI